MTLLSKNKNKIKTAQSPFFVALKSRTLNNYSFETLPKSNQICLFEQNLTLDYFPPSTIIDLNILNLLPLNNYRNTLAIIT